MSLDRISLLNVFFMLAATFAAYVLPFEVFLFSYAVLGPAHYLTEISWLHDKGYFTSDSRDYVFLACLSALVVLPIGLLASDALLVSAFFVSALTAVKIPQPYRNLSFLTLAFFGTLFVVRISPVGSILAPLLATIFHVYFFTGAFILYGALKRKSGIDILSLFCFLGCGVLFFLLPPEIAKEAVAPALVENTTPFAHAISVIRQLMGMEDSWRSFVTVMGFFAFAYTYHYLNWFSKTRVIEWHRISKQRAGFVILIYLASLGLYYWNYQLGFQWLLFLSLLHVVLEFPLNHRTFVGIARETRLLVFPKHQRVG